MEEVLSLEFPVTTPEGEVILLLPQISLSRGLERTFDFSAGNEEGRKVTEEYINYTFEYYTVRKEKEKISQSENPERWTELKNQEDVNIEFIKQYQLLDTIIQFSNAAKRREESRLMENQRKALNEALIGVNTIPVTSPRRESLLITTPPITAASNNQQSETPLSTNNSARMDLFNKGQRRRESNHLASIEEGVEDIRVDTLGEYPNSEGSGDDGSSDGSSVDTRSPEEEYVERIILALQKHVNNRDIACKEYQVLWYNIKYWYGICINNPKIMTSAIFETNFEKQFEQLFLLSDRIREFGNIFDAYSETIKKVLNLVNTFEVTLNKEDHQTINDLIVEIQVSLNPQQGSDFFSLYFGPERDFSFQIQREMLDQLQFHKHVEKRQMIKFDPTFNTKGYITRGEGLVKSTDNVVFSATPGNMGFRNLNPNSRTIPLSNAALKPTPIKHNSPYNIGLPSSGNNVLQGQGG